MSPHLSEAAVEAIANDRGDLVDEAEKLHAIDCGDCAHLVAFTAALSQSAEVALRRVVPSADLGLDLDAMVSTALARVPTVKLAPALKTSRRSLAFGAAIALAACVPFAAGFARHLPMPSDLFHALRISFAMSAAIHHVMSRAIPGGTATASLAGVFLVGLLAVPLRLLLGDAHPARMVQEADR